MVLEIVVVFIVAEVVAVVAVGVAVEKLLIEKNAFDIFKEISTEH